MVAPNTPTSKASDVRTADGGSPEIGLRRAIWIQLFALAMKARLADGTPRGAYESFTARFDGHNLTLYAASFSNAFLETLPAVIPPDSALQLYLSQTVDLWSQDGRREAARTLLGLIRYLDSTKGSKH